MPASVIISSQVVTLDSAVIFETGNTNDAAEDVLLESPIELTFSLNVS